MSKRKDKAVTGDMTPTIRSAALNRRAPDKERQVLFMALQDLANLSDGRDALHAFRQKWPNFFPAALFDRAEKLAETADAVGLDKLAEGALPKWQVAEETLAEGPEPEWAETYSPDVVMLRTGTTEAASDRVHLFRDLLRAVWAGEDSDDNQARLSLMLGIGDPHTFDPTAINVRGVAARSAQVVNWKLGEIQYQPATEFQSALYQLLRQSWRARVCRICGRYFIADKPPQMYCSGSCYGESKKQRDLEYWKREGDTRRKERKDSKPKRGKSK